MNLENGNCLELLKTLGDNSIDLIFCDPPYALGSEVIIKANGKPEYKKAVDFMNKWNQPDGTFWEEWFCEARRVLKHGGHCLMFGMDRQLWFNCYYANLSGFTQKQFLYWYFISNFPKASDLSKNLDKYFKAEREVVGKKMGGTPDNENSQVYSGGYGKEEGKYISITDPSTPLAKKYEGIKYSVCPMKQTNETIMVFQKPYKTGSCLHDVLAMEAGDNTLTCGGVDIEGNRCGVMGGGQNGRKATNEIFNLSETKKGLETGRFPAQTYIDNSASEIIDLQSGVLKSGDINPYEQKGTNSPINNGMGFLTSKFKTYTKVGDSGGASRILHRCDFEAGEYDLYHYCPKVSKSERNEGLEGFDNSHPTLKPKALLSKILKLFKTPNDQILLDPFMGSGSMGISAIETGYDYIGYELDSNYFKIAEARIQNAQKIEDNILI